MTVTQTALNEIVPKAVESAKASLLERFEDFLNEIPERAVIEMASHGDISLFQVLLGTLVATEKNKLSASIRNQLAYKQNKGRAFEQIQASYELLDSPTVCALLGISRQALSKKVQAGLVLAYTHGAVKHYPAFQFVSNAVIPAVARLTKEAGVGLDSQSLNVLLGFLAVKMNFADPHEPENNQPRYRLLANEAAFSIIVRDFANRLAMGK